MASDIRSEPHKCNILREAPSEWVAAAQPGLHGQVMAVAAAFTLLGAVSGATVDSASDSVADYQWPVCIAAFAMSLLIAAGAALTLCRWQLRGQWLELLTLAGAWLASGSLAMISHLMEDIQVRQVGLCQILFFFNFLPVIATVRLRFLLLFLTVHLAEFIGIMELNVAIHDDRVPRLLMVGIALISCGSIFSLAATRAKIMHDLYLRENKMIDEVTDAVQNAAQIEREMATLRRHMQRNADGSEDGTRHGSISVGPVMSSQSGTMSSDSALSRLGCTGNIEQELKVLEEVAGSEGWLIPETAMHLKGMRKLASGGFGSVYQSMLHGTPVAVKVAKNSQPEAMARQLMALGNEIFLLRSIRHPSIVQFLGVCVAPSQGFIGLVLELVEGASLDRVVTHEPTAPSTSRAQVSVDICHALMYLHSQVPPLVHGDLKPANIQVSRWLLMARATLLDFGLARRLTPSADRLGGTKYWKAPEVASKRSLTATTSVDVFAFGSIVFYIESGKPPLIGERWKRLVRGQDVEPLKWLTSPPYPFLDDTSRQVCEGCLALSPAQRPPIERVSSHLESLLPKVQEQTEKRASRSQKQVNRDVVNKKSDVVTSGLSDFERQCFANYLAALDNEGNSGNGAKAGGEAKGSEVDDPLRMSI